LSSHTGHVSDVGVPHSAAFRRSIGWASQRISRPTLPRRHPFSIV
jgi:hypothetical protein